jgi:hypothetical protein
MPKDTTALKKTALLGICNIWICQEQWNTHVHCIILYDLTYQSKFQFPLQDILHTHKIQTDHKTIPQTLQLQPETPIC